ncbi:hypothetical protein N0V83_008030 [Neocucurbitaria cava]|uniref:RING-type domain-containing protein n=1 Tax=Neocucurbitaria cava TaxID=798079 RepID=A0A9W8Y3X4_9PLEO|nr:hypothetical protein N0V83_008030 [Neocucurbitaria cava]
MFATSEAFIDGGLDFSLGSDAEGDCSICADTNMSELVQVKLCGHEFHMGCLKEWLHLSNTCPLCRVSLFKPYEESDREIFTEMLAENVVLSFQTLSDIALRGHVPEATELLRHLIVRLFFSSTGDDDNDSDDGDGNDSDDDDEHDSEDEQSNSEDDLPDDFVI